MHGPRVPGDRDALRPVVGEQLEEHVREAEQRVGGEALARRQLLGQREERAVGEVVAVDEEELGVARRGVVELELLPGQRLRGHLCESTSRDPARDRPLRRRASRRRRRAPRRAPRARIARSSRCSGRRRLPRASSRRSATSCPASSRWSGDEVVGYLVGKRREDQVGPHVWSYDRRACRPRPGARRATSTRAVAASLGRRRADRATSSTCRSSRARRPVVPALVRRLGGARRAGDRAASRPSTPASTIRESTPDDVARRRASSTARCRPRWSDRRASPGRRPTRSETVARRLGGHVGASPRPTATSSPSATGAIVGHILLYRRPPDLRVPADSIDLAQALDPAG